MVKALNGSGRMPRTLRGRVAGCAMMLYAASAPPGLEGGQEGRGGLGLVVIMCVWLCMGRVRLGSLTHFMRMSCRRRADMDVPAAMMCGS